MADLTLPTELVEQLDAIARREQRTVQSLIQSLLTEHTTNIPDQATADDPEKREALLKEDRIRLYNVARRYWRGTGDPRQGMTDDELEEQFWLIDHEGIPRLKSEPDTVDLPENPLQTILDAVALDTPLWMFGESSRTVSERSREILQNEYADYLMARMRRPAVPRDE
jgi:hypothetical protein